MAKHNRRSMIVSGAALIGAAAVPRLAAGATPPAPGLAPAADLLDSVRRFQAGLDPEQRKASSFAWNGPSGAVGTTSAPPDTSSQGCGLSR